MPVMPKGRYAPPVHMIKLTETREITPYIWVHPDEERWSERPHKRSDRRGSSTIRKRGTIRELVLKRALTLPSRRTGR